jgi:hypothetical protein
MWSSPYEVVVIPKEKGTNLTPKKKKRKRK